MTTRYTKYKKKQKLRNNEYYNTQAVQDKLYKESKEGKKFKWLLPLILQKENILEAYRNIKKKVAKTHVSDKARTKITKSFKESTKEIKKAPSS